MSKKLIKKDYSRGIDEGNFAEFPALLSGNSHFDQKERRFEKTVLENGKEVTRIWRVTGNEEYGLPTSRDAEVYFATLKIAERNGLREELVFSLYELIQLMNWPDDGASYQRAREGIYRLRSLEISGESAFFDIKSKRYTGKEALGIFQYAFVPEMSEVSDRREPVNKIIWNKVFLESIKNGYIMSFDLDVYFSLKSPLAQKLMVFLNKKFGSKLFFEMDIKVMAHEHLGVSRTRSSPAQIRQILDSAANELIEKNWLDNFQYKKKYRGVNARYQRFHHRQIKLSESTYDPVGALTLEVFGNSVQKAKKEHQEVIHQFVEDKGRDQWEKFIEFVKEVKKTTWNDMNHLGGALTLMDQFLAKQTMQEEEKKSGEVKVQQSQWWEYLKEMKRSIQSESPERVEDFDQRIKDDSKYVFAYEVGFKNLHMIGSFETTVRFQNEANTIYWNRFVHFFVDDGVQAFEEWAGVETDKELPLLV